MKINQLVTTLLAIAPSTGLSAILSTGVPEDHVPAVKKVVGALCSEAQESDKPFVVSLGDDSFYCDEESTGLVANAAMASLEETVMASQNKGQLRVKGQESGGFVFTWGAAMTAMSFAPMVIDAFTQDTAINWVSCQANGWQLEIRNIEDRFPWHYLCCHIFS